ncbi:glyoxylate/hydroxypyruvate reductase A [Phyllobacterium brassicacearum]|uniref:Glyoxylate/hydroxypyruvate reductase A n=1 Tax=Phyllobacterium brassicacearum TaxID=314235 RepID=A0A2P7BPH4_9HYPH|nr:glyoxylate/hydroxypyruvate reductase A [Phyllobacterium brassicacearum]PSH68363.1 glyoxylate/hydroxypyruvate reductase A [Phyllobacterium brassicacearum]TDQ31769.1 glyoxylate/hydroxypyruvate reductase A [Phyllobacterium brassicacearum]
MTGNADDKILLAVTGWDPEIWRSEFAKAASGRKLVLDADTDKENIRYALVWKQRQGSLAGLPNLEVIFSLGAGVDHVFHDLQIPDVPIVRIVSPDLTMRMSEYVVWQVLDHQRLGQRYRQQQRQKVWHEDRRQPAAHEVTVGILGLGVLGRDAAQKLRMLGFRVSGWSRRLQTIEGVTTHFGKDGLKDFLKDVDIVVCLLPLTPDTKGILSMTMFAQMKAEGPLGAPTLINAGRGGLQNEPDILSALDRGMLSVVTLDVFNKEPLPKDSPLWTHPQVMVTPHAAASSSPQALVPEIIAQIESYERGEPLKNIVDRAAQY